MMDFFGGMLLLLVVFAILVHKTLSTHDRSGRVKVAAAKVAASWLLGKLK